MRYSSIGIFCIFNILMLPICIAQNIYVGGGLLMSTYFGDLSPNSLKSSSTEIHPGFGFYISKKIFTPFYIQVEYEHCKLTGNDAKSNNEGRRLRNLSFESPLSLLAVSGKIQLKFNRNNTYGLCGSLGYALFKFDPRTTLNGKKYSLKYYSTEGQGLPGGPPPYKLIQGAIPVTGGIYIKVANNLYSEFQITQFFTNTDYLDDVSGIYYNPALLIQYKGQIAYDLSYRTKEILPTAPDYSGGEPRGNPKQKDQFLFMKLGFAWSFDAKNFSRKISRKKVNCPSF